jgi:NAD kinase
MDRLTENKIVLVVRQSRLDELIRRFNTESQARFYIEHLGADFSDYENEDRTYKGAIDAAQHILARVGRVQVVDRAFVPNFIFGRNDTVVVLGQDGLVANVLKYLDGQPVLGVNPDPNRWEGVLLPFGVPDLPKVVPEVLRKERPIKHVTMAKAELNTGQTLYGINDLFIGPKSHTSARYVIQIGDRSETHSSSGIIVSTGLGSTGWLRSIVAGATGIAGRLSQKPLNVSRRLDFPWDADYLCFSVREPWPSKTSSAEITFGRIPAGDSLRLISQMPDSGVIFSDGIESDFVQFNSGTHAAISVAERKGCLVM